MSTEEITILVEAAMASRNDTITKVFCSNKTYYGFFYPADDYEELKRLNKWRFIPNESSLAHLAGEEKKHALDKKTSVIIKGTDIIKIEVKTISVTK